ncbi:MAG: hypothetical protein B6245_05980 [Desulfobacteraceae bacterium 4572_88]|nr:MAG: hypothetical protein B6245_05980 [Desulfobacteraceae bacterium 4572_88]
MFFNYKKNRAWTEHLTIVMQIGLTMAGCIVFCFFVGWHIDKWLGTRGIFVTIFTILGVVGKILLQSHDCGNHCRVSAYSGGSETDG